jgi:small subunit ribosomal protein S4
LQVNGRKVNIPSYQVSVGEEIAIREGSKKLAILEPARNSPAIRTRKLAGIDRDNYKGRFCRLPKREDIHLPVNEQLIVEVVQQVA